MSRKFHRWVDEYQNQAWTLARCLLNDPAEAEDACQEAFVKLWRHQDRIDPAKVRPWLMSVTRNGCLDRIRRRRHSEEFEDWRRASERSGPMEELQADETGRQLSESIRGLGEPYRSLVILRDIQQHSYDEVAGMLELSLTQVKVYLHRARKQLREELAELRP